MAIIAEMSSQTNHYRQWTEEDDNYLREHYTLDGVKRCADHLGRSKNATWARTNLLRLKRKREYPQHIRMDRIKTPTFAYVLGYLWADGSLIKNKNGVCFTIAEEDGLAIKLHMDYTGTWNCRKVKRIKKNHKDKLSYTVWDERFVNLLRDLGFADKNHRSFDLVCAHLGDELVPYFVHGFFDGDGCIASTTKVKIYTVTFAAPLKYDWSCLKAILAAAGVKTMDNYYRNDAVNKTGSTLYFRCQEDVLRFYRVFIHHPEVGLQRKRVRFEEFAQKIALKYAEKRTFSPTSNGKNFVALGYHGKGKYTRIGQYPTVSEAQAAVDEWEKIHRPDLVALRAQIRDDLAHVTARSPERSLGV